LHHHYVLSGVVEDPWGMFLDGAYEVTCVGYGHVGTHVDDDHEVSFGNGDHEVMCVDDDPRHA
jgi:hypothetical protein